MAMCSLSSDARAMISIRESRRKLNAILGLLAFANERRYPQSIVAELRRLLRECEAELGVGDDMVLKLESRPVNLVPVTPNC